MRRRRYLRMGFGGSSLQTAPAAPVLTLISGPGDNTPDFTLTGDLVVGDTVRFQYSTSAVFSGASEVTNTIDAGEDAANELDFSTGPLSDVTWYFRDRTERPGHLNSDWSNTQTETIDTTAPTISTASTANCAENATLAVTLAANETVTWSIVGGADQARFEISSTTLRWASNGTKDFETPNDADTNNTYIVTVRATDAAGNTTDKTITVTVTDVAEDAAATTAFLARTSGLDATHIAAYKALINGLVSDGIFSKLDALYIFATADETTAQLSLVSATYNATKVSTPTFTTDRGYAGDASTKYIDTNLNLSSFGGLYSRNSCHLMVWDRSGSDGLEAVGLTTAAGNAHIYTKHPNTNAYFRIQNSGAGGSVVANANGFYLGNRSASNAWQGYKDGSSINSGADASEALANAKVCFPGKGDGSGTADVIAAGSIGGSLNATEVGNYYARMHTYMQTIAGVA